MYTPQGTQQRLSGAPSMSSQMSLDNAHQDMTSAYPMQGQMRGMARPDQSPLANFSCDGLPVDVFGPTGLQGIQHREQSMAGQLNPKVALRMIAFRLWFRDALVNITSVCFDGCWEKRLALLDFIEYQINQRPRYYAVNAAA
ncbi:hypothetical protein P692DRAFT_20822866 [Suillus brevipes Sb2]|nr:hypothetical protein P692DRAFT_20822866 [Suillus brevipes Sb2]